MIRIYQIIIDAAGLPEWMMWLSIPVGIITTGLIISLILRVTNRETGDHDASNVVPNKAAPEFPASTTAKEAQLYPWEEATPKKSKKPILIGGGVCALLAVAAVAVLALLLTGNESAPTAATVPAAQGTPPVQHATDPQRTRMQPNAATPDPDHIKELGHHDWFFGQALAEANRGTELFHQGDYDGAIQAYQSAQIHHGKPSSVMENRIGWAFLELGNHQQAIDHFTKAIEIEDGPTDRVNRAISYIETDQCPLAIHDAQQALDMKPESTDGYHTDAEAHRELRDCHMAIGDYAKAVENARAALKLMETHQYTGEKIAKIHIGLGNALYADDRAAEAIQHYSQAIALDDTAEARASRAEAYIATKDCISALTDSHKALEMEPESTDGYHTYAKAHILITSCHITSGDNAQVIKHIESALTLMEANKYSAEQSAAINVVAGSAYYWEGSYAKAIKYYSQAIALGDTAEARASRAWVYIETKDCISALTDSHKALEMPAVSWPGYHSGAHAHDALAYCYRDESQWEKALQHHESALSLMYENHYEAGKITMAEEDVEFLEFLRTQAAQ